MSCAGSYLLPEIHTFNYLLSKFKIRELSKKKTKLEEPEESTQV